MKSSLKIMFFFISGLIVGKYINFSYNLNFLNLTTYALYFLLVFVGISIGSDEKILISLKSINIKILSVPLGVIVGSLFGAALYSLIFKTITYSKSMAIGAGFGYYSLSSIIITELCGEIHGFMALLSNIIREIFTLIFTPLLVKYFGKIAPIASGGATSMDTSLPIIAKYSGNEVVFISVINGIILSLLVPFLIPIILKIF